MPAAKGTRRRLRLVVTQPLLNFVARKNARTHELAAAMQLPRVACGASLASHISAGNRWKGSQQPATTAADAATPTAPHAAQLYVFAEDGEPCE